MQKHFHHRQYQVLPLASWPYNEKLSLPAFFAALINNEPEPHVGSQIRAPGFDLVNRAISVDTSRSLSSQIRSVACFIIAYYRTQFAHKIVNHDIFGQLSANLICLTYCISAAK